MSSSSKCTLQYNVDTYHELNQNGKLNHIPGGHYVLISNNKLIAYHPNIKHIAWCMEFLGEGYICQHNNLSLSSKPV